MEKLRRSLQAAVFFVGTVYRRRSAHKLSVYAASSCFYLLLSLVPFLGLLVQTFRFLPSGAAQDFFASDLFPPAVVAFFRFLIGEVDGAYGAAAISVTALAALWAAGKGASAIRGGLLAAQQRGDDRGYLRSRIFGSVYVVLFLLVLAGAMILMMFGTYLSRWIRQLFPHISQAVLVLVDLRLFAEIGLLFFLLLVLYRFSSGGRGFAYALPGAIAATAGWYLFTLGFSVYLSHSAQMSLLYGSLSAIVIVLLWLYFCVEILFLGVEINEIVISHKNDEITP